MKLLYSSKTKLIKLAEEDRKCRLCSTSSTKNVGYLPVVPYSLSGEPTTNKIRRKNVPGCTNCNNTGVITIGGPSYTECSTCKKGSNTNRGIGQGPGIYRPHTCKTCKGNGSIIVPVHGGARDQIEFIVCSKCKGNSNNIPLEICPTCEKSDKPGFVQYGESKHNVVCPACKGSKTHKIITPYTPILQVKCPHLNGEDTFTKPKAENVSDELGPYDNNYFEGQRLLPLRLLWKIRGIESKYEYEKKEGINLSNFDGEKREIGLLTPPLPPIKSIKEPSYLDFFSRTDLLNPDHQRTANNLFQNIKNYFNSKTAKSNDSGDESNNGELREDFFGKEEGSSTSSQVGDINLNDFLPEGLSLYPLTPSKRTLTSEENKRLNGGPITVRRVEESDLQRPFKQNPTKALIKTKSMLQGQKAFIEKRSRMSKMFKDMTDIENEPDDAVRNERRRLGLRPAFRNWRDNLQNVSENLDIFGQLRKDLRNKLSPIIGKRMDPEVATALTIKAFRNSDALSQNRLGITEPMPYFKNDESWHETYGGFGCDHDPGKGHEPGMGCIIDYHNNPANPREGITTGVNSRLVVGKYTNDNGITVLRTVGARLKRPIEVGSAKRDLREMIPQWTPENFGRIVELPSENATCVPNKIQREHYVVNHTVESPIEKTEYTSLPPEETGIPGLKPERILNKEKIKFPEEIRKGAPKESVYVGNPLYQLSNPFSRQEVQEGIWANNPVVQHFAKQVVNGKRPKNFKPYTPEPKFNSQQLRQRPGLTGPITPDKTGINFDDFDVSELFAPPSGENSPKISKREMNELNPVEQDADETYDYNEKIKTQKMQRTQVKMVEPTNPSAPDITPDVPKINYK